MTTKSTKIIYATDVHGNTGVYEKIFELAVEEKVNVVVLGGDICEGFDMQNQRDFLEFYLTPRIKQFNQKYKIPVVVILGNDDYKMNEDVIKDADKEGYLHYIHEKSFTINGFTFIGYNIIDENEVTILKDWEKPEEEILKDLKKLSKLAPAKTSIYSFHAPPHNTHLDVHHSGTHVGSEGIKQFIEEFQPLLTLHGHIHESLEKTGVFAEKIGKTVSVNPGNANIIILNLVNPDKITHIRMSAP